MPQEEGVVLSLEGRLAKVRVPKSKACSGCSASRLCFPHGDDHMILQAVNEVGAREGDRVRVSIETGHMLRASMIVYLVPLVALLLGIVIGGRVAGSLGSENLVEVGQVLGALIAVAVSFLGIYLFNKNLGEADRYRFRIVARLRSVTSGASDDQPSV